MVDVVLVSRNGMLVEPEKGVGSGRVMGKTRNVSQFLIESRRSW